MYGDGTLHREHAEWAALIKRTSSGRRWLRGEESGTVRSCRHSSSGGCSCGDLDRAVVAQENKAEHGFGSDVEDRVKDHLHRLAEHTGALCEYPHHRVGGPKDDGHVCDGGVGGLHGRLELGQSTPLDQHGINNGQEPDHADCEERPLCRADGEAGRSNEPAHDHQYVTPDHKANMRNRRAREKADVKEQQRCGECPASGSTAKVGHIGLRVSNTCAPRRAPPGGGVAQARADGVLRALNVSHVVKLARLAGIESEYLRAATKRHGEVGDRRNTRNKHSNKMEGSLVDRVRGAHQEKSARGKKHEDKADEKNDVHDGNLRASAGV